MRKLGCTKKMVKDRPSLKMHSNSKGEPSPTKNVLDSRETVGERELKLLPERTVFAGGSRQNVCWQTSSLPQH